MAKEKLPPGVKRDRWGVLKAGPRFRTPARGPSGPNQLVISDYSTRGRRSEQQANRADRSKSADENYLDAVFKKLFGVTYTNNNRKVNIPANAKWSPEFVDRQRDIQPKYVMPKTGHQVVELRDPALPRVRVVQALEKLLVPWASGIRGHGEENYHRIKWRETLDFTTWYFFHATEFFAMRVDHVNHLLEISCKYAGRARMLTALERDNVVWVERKQLVTDTEAD